MSRGVTSSTTIRRHTVGFFIAVAIAAMVWSCSTTTSPGTVTTTTTSVPASTNNTPPVIQSVTVGSPRVEAGDEVQLTATVTDAESNPSTFAYAWSVSPARGTFVGTGASVKWQSPMGQATPAVYTFTVTVTETFQSGGQTKTNVVSSSAASVHYNDSVAEVGGLATQFLTDFATFSVSPEQCVRNFSDSCRGKADELSDIQDNRAEFHILSAELGNPSVSLNASLTFANVSLSCVFFDIPNAGPNAGKKERVPGLCSLTAIYDNFRWFLCESHFQSTGPVTPADLQHRVPGQVIYSKPLDLTGS